MARAIVSQVAHDPHKFTPEMVMCQAAMFMLKNLYKYYKPLEIELLCTGESYESYCFNVRKQKNIMEFQMEKIGINCDKIKRATQILKGDRGYVCTGERE